MELFLLICNIFLYSLAFVLYGVCERHPEGKNTASPCRKFFHAMRLEGCKRKLLLAMRYERFNGTQITQIRQISAASLGITPKPAGVLHSLLCIFAFLHFCTVQNVWGCAYILYIISQ